MAFRTVFSFLCFLLLPGAALAESPVLTATETVLPRFKSLSLDRDLPVSDILLDRDTLYIAGKHSLWKWNLVEKKLRRIKLLQAKEEGHLHGLVSDGIAVMTSYDQGVFRIRKDPLRVLKFSHPMAVGGSSLGLSGASDKILWFHSKAIMKVDRYGRTLIPRYTNTGLSPQDKVLYDAGNDLIWIAKRNTILQTAAKEKIDRPKLVFESNNAILGIQTLGSELMAHTKSTVIRIDAEGRHIQSIPVTGTRELATMQITPGFHAYLFSDGLLEIYDMKTNAIRRYRLPLENATNAKLVVNGTAAAVIEDGIPRAFSLAQPIK